jgi:S-adenosylmethionine synthetase
LPKIKQTTSASHHKAHSNQNIIGIKKEIFMTLSSYVFTSESVSEGHPDKVCDRISDAVLDAFLAEEPEARVACETFATTNRVVIGGEVGLSDKQKLSSYMGRIDEIARACIKDIGYEQDKFHHETVEVTNLLHEQSAHIAQGVDAADNKDEGAGDQGIMFGYATNETEELMPAPIQYSHAILRRLAEVRKDGTEPTLGPDAKSQLSVRYENGKPVGVTSIVLSTQHLDEAMTSDDVRLVVEPYIRETLPEGWITADTAWHVNPTGKFVIGGPDGDAGLTGRKIIVDTYGGAAPHGGGAFSGKDPTKVDRSAAYAARYLAKNVVAAGMAEKCTIQLSYAIGVARPLSIYADTFGTGQVSEEQIEKAVSDCMDLTPRGIRTHLGLNKPIYQRTAAYGHFGRKPDADGGFSWERTDLIDALKASVSI